MSQAMQHLERKKSDFNIKWRSFFENKFRENALNPKVEYEWQKYAGAKRQYFTVDDYKVTTCDDTEIPKTLDQATVNEPSSTRADSGEYKEIVDKMKTTKKSSCSADCACQDHTTELRHKLSQTELLLT